MSAMILDSGSYPLVRHASRTNDTDRTHETPRPSHWLSAAGIAVGGVVLLLASGIPLVLWATADGRGPGRTLLLAITAVVLAAGAIALLLAWHACIRDRQEQLRLAKQRSELDQTAMAMACAAAKLRVALAELPGQVRDRAAVQGAAFLGAADEITQRLGEVRDEVEAIRRCVEAEEVVDGAALDGDDRYLAGYADGLARRTAVLGENVRVLNGGRQDPS